MPPTLRGVLAGLSVAPWKKIGHEVAPDLVPKPSKEQMLAITKPSDIYLTIIITPSCGLQGYGELPVELLEILVQKKILSSEIARDIAATAGKLTRIS